MTAKRFHLGWFMNFALDNWNSTFSSDGKPWNGGFYVDMAKAMETYIDQLKELQKQVMSNE